MRVVMAFLVLVLVVAIAGSGAQAGPSGGGKKTCRGPQQMGGFFKLAGGKKITRKRSNCAAVRRLVRRYPRFCARAFAAQGRCRVRAGGRAWRCRSRMIGPATRGAPSRQRCRRRRARAIFVVKYFPPVEPRFGPEARISSGAYNEAGFCVRTGVNATPLPAAVGTSFEIRRLAGVSAGTASDVQNALVSRSADSRFRNGLDSRPRNDPARIRLFLSSTNFDASRDLGITAPTCSDRSIDGMVVRTNTDTDFRSTAAHELFHAYSFWGIAKGAVQVPWFEEAAATWATGKLGFPRWRSMTTSSNTRRRSTR
jgi:hypothetical protein